MTKLVNTSIISDDSSSKFQSKRKRAFCKCNCCDSLKIGDVNFEFKVEGIKRQKARCRFKGDIEFRLLISNTGSKEVSLGAWDFPQINYDFFTVYRIIKYDTIALGKPFELGLNSRDLLPEIVGSLSPLEYRLKWPVKRHFEMPNEKNNSRKGRRYNATDVGQKRLSKGKYISRIRLPFDTEVVDLYVVFFVD